MERSEDLRGSAQDNERDVALQDAAKMDLTAAPAT